MKKLLPVSMMLAVFILAACGSARSAESPASYNSPAMGGGAPASSQEFYAEAPAPDVAVSNTSGLPAANVNRIVIKNADLAIVVSDVSERMKNIQVMAEQMGGFVVSSNLYKSYTNNNLEVPEAQIVIRVPAEKLDEVLDQIKKDVVDVQTETVSGQDVTSEYVDLQSRLKNLETAEAQLNDILENATDTTDVVNIFNQLVAYREQIEVIKGQIKYYDESASLSAVSIRIIAEETVQPLVIGKWEPKGVALQAVQDLIDFTKGFVEFLIRFVIYILPVWIMIGVPLYLVFLGLRALFRKMRGNKVKKDQPQETPAEKK
ncbi:MAG: DUF4349 domain-containing protein [Chloroflexi bacterium]|nr:DUF4349 domain-containing protein [Chloroflexota bacterium]